MSIIPLLYVYQRWPEVPTLVAIHFSRGTADRWAPRDELWTVAWWPVIAFVVFIWWPQVRNGSWFWRSARQREVRALVVAALVVFALCFVYAGIRSGKWSPAHSVTATVLR